MSIDQGQNVAEVRDLANSLRQAADKVDQYGVQLAKLVDRSNWVGPAGAKFKQQWWPQHRSSLRRLAGDLRTFADQATKQADEQQRASDAGGVSGSSGGFASAASGASGAMGNWITHGDWNDLMDKTLFFGGKAVDLESFIKNFKSIKQLEGLGDLFKVADKASIGPLSVLSTGWDIKNLFNAVSQGSVDGSVRKGIDVGFDLVGTKVPQVALAKGAWDVGWQVGKGIDWFFGEHLGGHQAFSDSVVATHYGGTLTSAEADDYAHRYDGWSGFGHFVGDNVTETGNAAKGLWKKVFG
jgi:uncharacterized protein YukE